MELKELTDKTFELFGVEQADQLGQALLKACSNTDKEDIIQDYMNEYATYGWDATCTDIVNIAASVDCVTLQLKYAKVED